MHQNLKYEATTTAPMVSVCIPAYYAGENLRAAIESVLAQNYQNFELLIVDDASPEDIQGVVNEFNDERIFYVRNKENLGPEGNWNRCLLLSSGRYFKLLPHDDLLHPECLMRQVATLEEDKDQQVALVFSSRQVICPSGNLLMHRRYPGSTTGLLSGSDVKRACVRHGTNLLGEPGAVLFRKSLGTHIGKFNATQPYVIDLDYWFRLLTHGSAFYIFDSLASFRLSRKSWSVAIGSEQDNDFRTFVERISNSLDPRLSTTDRLLMQINVRVKKWMRQIFYVFIL